MANPIENLTECRMTQTERTALSDNRMLEVAIKLIGKRGTGKTTLKEVGELAGYSRGLASYRFGSKEGLFSFIVHAISEEWLHELTKATAGKHGIDAIQSATDAHYQFCCVAPDHVRAFYILWFESISPGSEAKEVIVGVHRRRQRDVTEWITLAINSGEIDPSVDASNAATQYCSALVGIVYQWLLKPDSLDEIGQLHEGLKRTMDILLTPGNIQEQ